jgi:hypothetical protein
MCLALAGTKTGQFSSSEGPSEIREDQSETARADRLTKRRPCQTRAGRLPSSSRLLTGFLWSDIADQQRQAWQAVHNEASAIITAFNLSDAAPSDMEGIRSALQAYAEAVLTDEWPKLAQDQRSALVDRKMEQLLRRVSGSSITREAGQALHNNLLRTVLQIREARSDRLALTFAETRRLNWATVLLLGIFTQLAIALVHLERPRAQAAALLVFSLAAVIALGLIALQEHPFKSSLQISPAPLRRAISIIAPP